MRHLKPLPDIEYLRSLLSYDPVSGLLTWKVRRGSSAVTAGDVAGTLCPDGYIRVTIDGRQYAAHRLAWKMQTGADPSGIVDHRDHETTNNRFDNLRDTTQGKNLQNTSRRSDNKTGYKGVVVDPRNGRYRINLKVDGVRINLPSFATAEEAHRVAVAERAKAHADFAFSRFVDSDRRRPKARRHRQPIVSTRTFPPWSSMDRDARIHAVFHLMLECGMSGGQAVAVLRTTRHATNGTKTKYLKGRIAVSQRGAAA